jgi:hypothetical protein
MPNMPNRVIVPPTPRPGEVSIESESGVYIDAPRAVRETTSPAAARPARPEPASWWDVTRLEAARCR